MREKSGPAKIDWEDDPLSAEWKTRVKFELKSVQQVISIDELTSLETLVSNELIRFKLIPQKDNKAGLSIFSSAQSEKFTNWQAIRSKSL